MARRKNAQIRLGKLEQKEIERVRKALKKYKVFAENKKLGETQLNERLRDHLRQIHVDVEAKSAAIPSTKLVRETFRPDIYGLNSSEKPLWCIECKKLTEQCAKARLKEGMAQAIIYTAKFKVVFLVLYDFTKDGRYAHAFGRGNSTETTLSKTLRDSLRINLIVIEQS